MKIANIKNGEVFNQYFERTFYTKGIPFNEAIMVGNSTSHVFSNEFCINRASQLNASIEEYYKKLNAFFKFIRELEQYEEIILWFGSDTFCQLNLLTILCFLETRKYKGNVFTVIIDDESFNIIRGKTPITLVSYQELYEKILLNKEYVKCNDSIMDKAISLYFYYLSDKGKLAMIIKNNNTLSENQLIEKLLLEGMDYGISDLQAYHLIKKCLLK